MKRAGARLLASFIALAALGCISASPPALAQQAQPPGNEAEITFWNSIKDSQTAAEFEAYLQAFPSGVFAPLARLRIQQIASGGGNPPPQQAQPIAPPQQQFQQPPPQQFQQPPQQQFQPAPPPQNAFVDTTDRQVVAEIQQKLYNLNYQVRRFDGVFDTSTRDAIRDWQKRIEVIPDGNMTEALLTRLRNSKVPMVWGSVAYTANGVIGRSWNRASRQEAEEVAQAECRKRAGRRASCDTLSGADSACLAVATYNATIGSTRYYGARVSLQPDLARAISNALQQCQDAERSRNTCVNKVAFCANGSHER